jgi:ABC-type phosphate/phosphonate transport system substrate-binding protein
MYDLPEVRWATDALWTAIARELDRSGVPGVPMGLMREGSPADHWSSDDLLFSQSCGFPVMHDFADVLQIVATPTYRAPGCGRGTYASVVLVADTSPAASLADLRGTVCAMNDRSSHSGMNVFRAMVAPLATEGRFFARVVVTGSHLGSIDHVRAGDADVASIDAVTYALLSRHRPSAVAGTRVLAISPPAPALPYVTRARADSDLVTRIRHALGVAMHDPELASARDALLLEGIVVDDGAAYAEIVRMAESARALGYPDLA